MSRRRLFLGIRLPDNLKRQLATYQNKWNSLPAKWVKEKNLHITLLFLGRMRKDQVKKTVETVHEVEEKVEPFSVNFEKVTYAPPGKEVPRLIWVQGQKSDSLTQLREELKKELHEARLYYGSDDHEFIPHITLARLKKWAWKRMNPMEKPTVKDNVNFQVDVNNFEVIESKLSSKGPRYITLEKVNLSS